MGAATPLTDQAALELRISASQLVRMTNDVGGNTVDADVLNKAIAQGSARARQILWRGYPSNEQIELMVAADPAAQMHVEDLVIGLLGERRPGLLSSDGRTPYTAFRARAEKALRELADAHNRSPAEPATGTNATIGVDALPSRSQREPIFAATKKNPVGPGGF